jgi:hypothetical protein
MVSEYKLKTKDGRSWEDIEKELELISDPADKKRFTDNYGIKTKYVGRMLEIKCPMRRKILMSKDAPEVYGPHGEEITDLKVDSKKGICPSYYWVQVQLQLQCCELDECDFWQCSIFEYSDKDDFLDDTDPNTPWLSRQTGHEKGALIQLLPFDQVNNRSMEYKNRIWNHAKFIYQPKIDMTPLELDTWLFNTIQRLKITHKGLVFERVIYWKMITTRNITIKRDDKWFKDNLQTFRDAWDCVLYFRANQDKSKLLKQYLNTFPLDYYDKIKEKPKGIIMETINKMVAEPKENAPSKEHKEYAKFIASIEQQILKSKVEEVKEYDVNDDIEYIKKTIVEYAPIDGNDDDNVDDDEKKKYKDKYIAFVKQLKNDIDNFVFHGNE